MKWRGRGRGKVRGRGAGEMEPLGARSSYKDLSHIKVGLAS